MTNDLSIQSVDSANLQYFTNRWIELGLSNGDFFKFFVTYLNQNFIGGYLSRGSYRTFYYPPLSSMYSYSVPQNAQQFVSYQQINSWITLEFQNSQILSFFVTNIDENFIGGFIIRNKIKAIDLFIIRFQRFFEEYDRRFHPMFISQDNQIPIEEREKRIQVVRNAEQVLMNRVKKRVLFAMEGKIPNKNDMPSMVSSDVNYLSNLQLQLYNEFFLDEKGHLDNKKIQTCFELFDNGEIQGNKYPGNLQPDSASDFLFAEFALQAIECSIDSEVWGELLKTFVKTQEIFIQVYRPIGIKIPKLSDYKFSNFKYYKQVNNNQKEVLRKKYDNMSKDELEWEYGKNLLKAQSAYSIG
ncbi:hypothetical protein V7150_24280 [Neobacillus drentensis]|uniref:hypothetical protein n=1 Tax=Neobacillus drentensis TaxID=220684 RepID=UPI002FFEF4EB